MSHDTEHKTRIESPVSQRPAGFTEAPRLQEKSDVAIPAHQPVESSPNRNKGRRRGLKIGLSAAVATALTAGGAYLLTSNDEKPVDDEQGQGNEQIDPNSGVNPDDPIEQAPVNTDPEVTDPEVANPEIEVPALPADFTPETLSSLTPEQLTEKFQIHAEDIAAPENFAQVFTDRFTSLLNAGGTIDESLPYEAQVTDEYQKAMIEKYHTPITLGLFGFEDVKAIDLHEWVLTRYKVMFGLGREYHSGAEVIDESTRVTPHEDGSFDIEFTIHEADTYNVKDVIGENTPGTDPVNTLVRRTFSGVRALDSGVVVWDSATVDGEVSG